MTEYPEGERFWIDAFAGAVASGQSFPVVLEHDHEGSSFKRRSIMSRS